MYIYRDVWRLRCTHTTVAHTLQEVSVLSWVSPFFFFPSQFHACSLHKCFFTHVCWWLYVCVMRGMQQSRGMNESYVQFMTAAGHAAVFSRFKRKTVHAAVSSSLVWADFLNSQVMSQVRREKKFHNCVISADSDDASVCLSWQQREGGCICGVEGAQCLVHFF